VITKPRHVRLARAKVSSHEARLKLLEATYKPGEGETETMLMAWQQRDDLNFQIVTAEAEVNLESIKIQSLVLLPQNSDRTVSRSD
jgi:hypothetical protein